VSSSGEIHLSAVRVPCPRLSHRPCAARTTVTGMSSAAATSVRSESPSAVSGRHRLRSTALAVGPAVSVALLFWAHSRGSLTVAPLSHYLVVALLFWSPLPFSLPAVLLDDYRDEALPGYHGAARLLRGLLLLPHLLRRGPGRGQVAVSLAGFAAAVILALPVLH
jgi:hypothetical protein